ncbi:isoprenylcysteine carboxylmethyltransferase family protein [Phaeobacter inhibens]|uniref:methyltransferase family protein n=1 Tax=Phaeobacter inhibens TaxID=221822 RepID=UPI0021A2F38C|nr:isoprenylcysteine carboxylmethyltransferase family protein [Phaeobacter inhibens]UWR77347.1 isoprenylcysteine carboxylmethyltransferase family protein [Phaeobacter inhibens]
MKWIDVPPVWLLGFAVLAWCQAQFLPLGLGFSTGPIAAIIDLLSGLLVGAGIVLMLLAVTEMRRQKTTLHPHGDPSQLVQSGIFKRSRNPIYLGDCLLLLGLVLRFDAALSLALLPIFVWVLERRFILPEENRLRRQFRADWARYEQKTRRWL